MFGAKICEMKFVHGDSRRDIYELNGLDSSVHRFVIKSDRIPLGEHCHYDKTETFVLVRGSGKIIFCGVDADNKEISKRQVDSLQEGRVIIVPEYVVHTFFLDPGSEMICFSSKPFDPNDMHKHSLIS